MSIYYWDTSALIKRYHTEVGTDEVNRLFEEIKAGKSKGIISYLGVVESISAIVRRRNEIGNKYKDVIKGMLTEIGNCLSIIPIDDDIMAQSMKVVLRHSLKTLDAIHLSTAIMIKSYINKDIIFISADKELLYAAEKEGFEVLNPEEM